MTKPTLSSDLPFPRHLLALVLVLAALVPIRAQQAPATRTTTNADETVTLSPFIISTERETGWSANETLSATRTKQALKDVPVNIDAITSDFMEDLGLYTADEVANYVANAWAPPTLEHDNQSIPSDTYNVERIDFGKGSNSLIFGDIEPGGQASVFTKRALMKNFGQFFAAYNNDGAYRFQLDYNRKLRDGLALRLNAVRRQERTFQDASTFQLEGETLTTTWQPFRNTLIRVEYERGDFENVRGFGGVTIREISARSRAYTSDRLYYTSDGEWIIRAQLPSADRSNGPAGGSPSLVEGGYFDVTMRNAAGAVIGTRRYNGYPKHYNLRGSFDRQNRPFHTYTATVEQRFGPVGAEISYNHQKQTAIRNDNFFSSTISIDVNGRPYVESELDEKRFGNVVDSIRGTVVYKFDRWKWMQQLFVGSAEYREDQVINWRFNTYNTANFDRGLAPAINTNLDRIRLRLFFDDPRFYSRALFDAMKPANLPTSASVTPKSLASFPSGTSATDGTQWRQASAVALSASGRYFNGRLQTLIGARHDWNRNYEYNGTRTFGPYKEEIEPPLRKDALPGEYLENKQLRLENTSMTGGLTLMLTKDLNLYGVYSESFRFQGLRTFDRERFPPITGVTKEIGIKGSFWQDKANVNLGVFNIDRQNVALSWNTIVDFNAAEVEDLMNPNDILPGDPRYKYSEEGTASASRYYKSTENSRGADLTLNLRPFRGLQMRFTVARTQVTGEPDLDRFRGYYEAAVKRGNELPALLADAKLLLDTLDIDTKPSGARAAPWSASWVFDYAFQRDTWAPLRGVRLGVNGSWRDDYLLGTPNGQELVGGATHLVHGYLMRDQKVWNQQLRVRLGVRNIIDLENGKLRKTSFTTMNDGSNVYRYSYVVPVQYELNMSVRF
ncbi:MAG: hypothetical protein HZC55_23595 [Verrucomicrobia bacterium]|nr:hypothetical protein [Verrucomicrobiota bacterium]